MKNNFFMVARENFYSCEGKYFIVARELLWPREKIFYISVPACSRQMKFFYNG